MKSRSGIERHGRFFVYILRCKKGTYYTGYTNNLENRIEVHNKGHGAKYLKGKLPVKLVYAKQYKYYKNAVSEEKRIKKLRRWQKEKLVTEYDKSG